MSAMRPRRPPATLEGYLQEQLEIDVKTFCGNIGMRHETLSQWWGKNRLLVKILVAGYRTEVRREVPGQ